MTEDELISRITSQFTHAVVRGNYQSSAQIALGVVEIRTRLRQLDAMLKENDRLVAGAMSELTEAVQQCEDVLADQRGAFDYAVAQARHIVKTTLAEFKAKQPPPADPEEHPISDPAVRQQVFALTGGTCAYCGIDLKSSGGDSDQFCVEHVVPASKGGPNHLVNYVPSCRSCNNSKRDSHVLLFIRRRFGEVGQ